MPILLTPWATWNAATWLPLRNYVHTFDTYTPIFGFCFKNRNLCLAIFAWTKNRISSFWWKSDSIGIKNLHSGCWMGSNFPNSWVQIGKCVVPASSVRVPLTHRTSYQLLMSTRNEEQRLKYKQIKLEGNNASGIISRLAHRTTCMNTANVACIAHPRAKDSFIIRFACSTYSKISSHLFGACICGWFELRDALKSDISHPNRCERLSNNNNNNNRYQYRITKMKTRSTHFWHPKFRTNCRWLHRWLHDGRLNSLQHSIIHMSGARSIDCCECRTE